MINNSEFNTRRRLVLGQMTHRFDKCLKVNERSLLLRALDGRTSLTRLLCPRQLDRLLGIVKVGRIEYASRMKCHG